MINAGLPVWSPQSRGKRVDYTSDLQGSGVRAVTGHTRFTQSTQGNKAMGHTGGWRPRSSESYSKPQAVPSTGAGVSRGGVSLVWLMSAGGSLPQLFGKVGDDGEGQEDHTSCASDDQAQDAAVHLHGLTALSRVEEGVIGDTPGEEDTWVHVGATRASSTSQPQAPTCQQWQ